MEATATIGMIGAIPSRGYTARSSVSRVLAITGASRIVSAVNKSPVTVTMTVETIRRLRILRSSPVASASETNLEMATGSPAVVRVIANSRMG